MRKGITKSAQEPRFARVLGISPGIQHACCMKTTNSLDFLVEVFGPPECRQTKGSRLLYWTFVRDDGMFGFSLFSRLLKGAKPPEVEVRLTATAGVRSFRDWVLGRMGATANGENDAIFLGGGKFIVSRIEYEQ